MSLKKSLIYTKQFNRKHRFYRIFQDIAKSFGYDLLLTDNFLKLEEYIKEDKIDNILYDNDLMSPELDKLIDREIKTNGYFSTVAMITDSSSEFTSHRKKLVDVLFLNVSESLFETSLFSIYKNFTLKDKLKSLSGVIDPDFTKKLLSDTAHAINNILTGMQGYAELAQLNPDDKQLIEDSFGVIVDSSYRIRDEIKNLRAFIRIENPQFDMVSVSDIMSETFNLTKIQIGTKGINVQSHIDNRIIIHGDYQQLVQVFYNLMIDIINNVKDGSDVVVAFSYRADNLDVTIRGKNYKISNNDFKSLKRIFELNYPVLKMDSKEGKIENRNVLSICNRIILNHNGSINVNRKSDNTLIYTVELPIFKHLAGISEIEELKSNQVYQDLENLNMEILVVDDEEYVRNTMYYFFNKRGCHVTLAEDGQYGLDIAKKEHFDLVFMDYLMPRMGGIESARKILKKNKDVKIVFITGRDTIDKEKLYKSGIYACIKKPFEIKDLYEIAKKVSLEKGLVN